MPQATRPPERQGPLRELGDWQINLGRLKARTALKAKRKGITLHRPTRVILYRPERKRRAEPMVKRRTKTRG